MHNNVQLSLFFCEDVRMEMSGKPFLIGMLSPVIHGGNGSEESFYLVTSVTAPANVVTVDLELTVTIDGPDREPETKNHIQTISIDDDDEFDDNEPWKAWLPLQIAVPNCVPGVRISANLDSSHGSAWASLVIKPSEDAPDFA